jgi:hypothetical protein
VTPRSLVLVVALVLLRATALHPFDLGWRPLATIPGVFDIGGPRTDGALVVAGAGRLYLLNPDGRTVPFAAGPGGYADDAGTEAYMAVSPGLHDRRAGCDFLPNDVFVLRLHQPVGITRVTQAGLASPFATLSGVQSLNGIAFDTTGSFGNRLLASAPSGGKMVIFAIDCSGGVQVITRSAPALEGGLAIAPRDFGSYGGALIAPDELSGTIYAIAPDGSVSVVAQSGLPAGQDIGVEGVGFVPKGFSHGGHAYFSDRGTPGSAHPGADHVLRLSAADLVAAGVQDGDLLAATEGGATMVAVHCDALCAVRPVVGTPSTAHGEGHIVFTLEPAAAEPSPSPSPSTSPTPIPLARGTGLPVAGAIVFLVAAGVVSIVLVWRRRRK